MRMTEITETESLKDQSLRTEIGKEVEDVEEEGEEVEEFLTMSRIRKNIQNTV